MTTSDRLSSPQHSTLDTRHSPATVFLVDDDASVRKALSRLIKSAGYQVQSFASAREFLDAHVATVAERACLVLDVSMPGLSGFDLQRELDATAAFLPIIFITGHGDIPMSVKAMKAGAVDFLPKPVKDKALLADLPPDELDKRLSRAILTAHTSRTITDREALLNEVALTRQRGYAVSDEELAMGLRAVAAPVRGAGQKAVAAINVSGSVTTMSRERLKIEIAPAVMKTAEQISLALGYSPTK